MQEQGSISVGSDAELVADLRAGHRSAMAQLYARHSADAMRVARIVSRDGAAEDLTAEAFARTFAKIVDGGGPTENFRAYLHTVIRNLNIERSRQASREHASSDTPWLLDAAAEDQSLDVDAVDAEHAARALRSLPENWQQLLWKLEVQGSKPAQVAAELDVPVATISDTAYRAREGLRLAYLNQYLPAADHRRCDWTRERLPRLVRGSLSPRASAKARDHLDSCLDCTALRAELHQLNTRLGAAIWPMLLVGGITLDRLRGAVTVGSAESTDAQDRPDSPSPSGAGSRLSLAARAPSSAVAAVAATIIVAVAATGWWLVRDASAPDSSASLPQKTAPAQVRPVPSGEKLPETANYGAADIDVVPATVTLSRPAPPDDRDDPPTPGPERTEPSGPTAPQPTPAPTPAPEPTEEPPAEPGPVDLGVGAPTIEGTGDPYRWLLTVPVSATEGAPADSFILDLELRTAELTGFIERVSSGWDCGPIEDGGANGDPYFFGGDTSVTCQYTYQPGQSVAPLQLVLESIDAPTGTLSVSGSNNTDPNASDDDRTF